MSQATQPSIKYLRISNTNETVSDITNYVAEPITIGSNSKIALDSMSIAIDQSKVIFDSINNTFQVQNTDAGELKNVVIADGSYTNEAFIKELTRALNATTVIEEQTNEIRTEWKPVFNTDGKLNIQYLTVMDDEGNDVNMMLGPNMREQELGGGTRTAFTSNNDEGGYVYMENKFINGTGIAQFPLITSATWCDNFAVGFINNIPSPNKATLEPEDFYFCLVARSEVSQFVEVYFNGGKITSPPLTINSLEGNPNTVLCYIDNGNIILSINNFLMATLPYTFAENLHGCFQQYPKNNPTKLLWYGNGNEDDTYYTPSPYQNSTSNGVSLITRNEDKIGLDTYLQKNNLGAAANVPTLHSLTMSNPVRLLLGYSNNYYELDAIGGAFTAENTFNTFVFDSDLLIELPSFMLQSYDGTTNRRRNIIRMVPANDTPLVGGRRRFTASFPIFISLTSREPQILNSLQFRILDSNSNKALPIQGSNSCYITLIVKSE